jgi:hypothetical protein
VALDKEQKRLAAVSNREIAELSARLGEARNSRLRAEWHSWQQEAATLIVAKEQAIDTEYSDRLEGALREDDARLINLQLRVNALTELTERWALCIPPAPGLAAAKTELVAATAELAEANEDRSSRLAKLDDDHQAALKAAVNEGDAYVASREEQEGELLRSDDAGRIALARIGLQAGMSKLLGEVSAAESRVWIKPTAMAAAVENSSPLPGAAIAQPGPNLRLDQARQIASIAKTRNRLMAERNRWLQYVHERACFAVLDLASARDWQLSFVRSRQYYRDVTPQVESALLAPPLDK